MFIIHFQPHHNFKLQQIRLLPINFDKTKTVSPGLADIAIIDAAAIRRRGRASKKNDNGGCRRKFFYNQAGYGSVLGCGKEPLFSGKAVVFRKKIAADFAQSVAEWWRRRELNPCPKGYSNGFLRAQFACEVPPAAGWQTCRSFGSFIQS